MLLTTSVWRSLLLLFATVSRTGILTVLNHDLLVSQLLNRALVLISNSLQTVLHSVTLIYTIPIVTALMTITTLSSRLMLFLEYCLRNVWWRRPCCIIVTCLTISKGRLLRVAATTIRRPIKNLVMAFPEICSYFLSGATLARTLCRCCLRIITDVRSRRGRGTTFIHNQWGVCTQRILSVPIIACIVRLLECVAMVHSLPIRCVLRRLCGLGSMEIVLIITWAMLRFHGLWGWHVSYLFVLLLSKYVQLASHGSSICAIFCLRSLQA